MKKKLSICLLFVFVLSGCGIGSQNTAEKNLETVVANLFQELDQAEYEEYQKWLPMAGAIENTSKDMPRWIEKRFKPFMTQKAYDSLLQTSQYALPVLAYKTGKSVEWQTNVNVVKYDSGYDFKGTLLFDADTIEVEGSAQIDKSEKVSFIQVYNMPEIAGHIREEKR